MSGEGWLAFGALIVACISGTFSVLIFIFQKREHKRRDEEQLRRDNAHRVNLMWEFAKDEKDPKKGEELIEEALQRFKSAERKVKKE